MWLISVGTNILFICTANISWSLIAEYALKIELGEGSEITVGSAGLTAPGHEIAPFVTRFLEEKGADISAHQPRKLTHKMLADSDLAVAMGLEHRALVARIFGYQLPLFSEIAYKRVDALADMDDVVPDWRLNPEAAMAYVRRVMNFIFDGMPGFVSRMNDCKLTGLRPYSNRLR